MKQEKSYITPRQRGTIVLFDSRTQHRVLKVTKGVRKSIVGWTVAHVGNRRFLWQKQMTQEVLGNQERRNSGTAWTRNDKFEKDGYLVVKDLWDAEDLYHPLPDIKGQLNYWSKDVTKFNHNPVEGQVEGSLARYWHPQYRKSTYWDSSKIRKNNW